MIHTPSFARRAVVAAVVIVALAAPAVEAAPVDRDDRAHDRSTATEPSSRSSHDLQVIELRCGPVETDRGRAAACAWEAAEGAVAGYALQRRDHHDEQWRTVAHGGPEFRRHVDGPLRPGMYDYAVVAFDDHRRPIAVSRPERVIVGRDQPSTGAIDALPVAPPAP